MLKDKTIKGTRNFVKTISSQRQYIMHMIVWKFSELGAVLAGGDDNSIKSDSISRRCKQQRLISFLLITYLQLYYAILDPLNSFVPRYCCYC